MSSGKMLRLMILGLVFIILVIGVLFAIRLTRSDRSEISMPTPKGTASADDEVIPVDIDILYVTEQNVQKVIATLKRPSAYSRDIMIERFWDGGSSVDNFNVSVRDGITALRTFFGGTAKNIVITDEYRYIWYAGDSEPVKVKNTSASADDENQMIVTYEDILKLDNTQIQRAGFFNGTTGPGIFVKYTSGTLGYITEVYVSIELGLITGAEQYDGDTLIYRMTTGACNLETPSDTGFILPNGINTLN